MSQGWQRRRDGEGSYGGRDSVVVVQGSTTWFDLAKQALTWLFSRTLYEVLLVITMLLALGVPIALYVYNSKYIEPERLAQVQQGFKELADQHDRRAEERDRIFLEESERQRKAHTEIVASITKWAQDERTRSNDFTGKMLDRLDAIIDKLKP